MSSPATPVSAPAPAFDMPYPDEDTIGPTITEPATPVIRVGQQWRNRNTRALVQVQRFWGQGVLIVPLREWEALSSAMFLDRYEPVDGVAEQD